MASRKMTTAPPVFASTVNGMTSIDIRRAMRGPGSSGLPSISRPGAVSTGETTRRRKESVVLLGQADGHPRAVPGERADQHLVLDAVLVERHRPLTQRQPEEVALRSRHVVAQPAQLAVHPVALGDHRRAPGEQL